MLTPLEGNTKEGNTRKEGWSEKQTNDVTFTIDELGLTNRQVWAATLGELARRGDVGRTELESWLRPAALIGREGETLILGAPNAVSRDRIATRLLPAVREALGRHDRGSGECEGCRGRRAPCRVKGWQQR